MIFGSGVPKIQNLDGSIIISFNDLDYSVGDMKPTFRRNVNESIFTGERHVHYKGRHCSIEINITGGVDRDMILGFESLLFDTVWFYRHYENSHRKLKCYVKNMKPYYYKNLKAKDALLIVLETVEFFNDTAGSIPSPDGSYPFASGFDEYFTDNADTKYTDEEGNDYIITGGNE